MAHRDEEVRKKKLSWRERIRHFTWTWFTMTMATGGVANVLYTVPFRFRGLYALGCIFFILNIVLFLFNISMISLRFYLYPRTFKASFLHPTESLFIPAAVISFGTILINISQYGVDFTGYWLEQTMIIMYWIDCGLAICFSIGIYLIMWSTQTFTISQMTPVWIFPAYPLLIIGPHAGNLAPKVSDPILALNIVISGYVIQGIGFLVSLMIYSAFLYRLMTQKLPKESLRPGMFISVGPSGFTVAGVISMGQILPKIVPPDFMGPGMGEFAGKVSMICANWMGLWLWGLAFWFFFVSVGAHWSCAKRGKMDFAMTWFSFVFPNTALTTATFAVARALGRNRPIQYVGCAMTVVLILAWFLVFAMMIRAVVLGQILWPQKQEDRTEGGWKQPSIEEQKRRGWIVDGELGDEDGRHWSLARTFSRRGRVGGSGERNSVDVDERRRRAWSMGRSMSRRR
ncbi:voltage-dependent anion channel-domain-containing protein [Clohesyomyces aquaticus]|uniref:Voltage-dependent anion channel-domain-containing protein n=1 Tax=Clohesyomyces aquaticus TaxID=1231657 RepID=A0A1Y2A5H7_9PLEO|nr:voltage-dependent anion channel-domain-containing protein [Clohesyomyces aquaticus]